MYTNYKTTGPHDVPRLDKSVSLRTIRALPEVQRQKCFQQDIQNICKLGDHKMVIYEVEDKDLQSKPSLAEKYGYEVPDKVL